MKKYGTAVVVMTFDEECQAENSAKKVWICKRSYDILVNETQFLPEDIMFYPNGTGMEEHSNYGVNLISAVKTIKEQCSYVKISDGISNLSF